MVVDLHHRFFVEVDLVFVIEFVLSVVDCFVDVDFVN